MRKVKKNYQFVNGETDNVIGYCSVPANEDNTRLVERLEKKRKELALKIGLYFENIYWRQQDIA